MIDALRWVLLAFNETVLWYFVLLNGSYLLTSFFAIAALRVFGRRARLLDVGELLHVAKAPPVTLLVPAYNEEATCVESTRSLLTLNYPDYEILVVNDGSKDGTVARMREAFEMAPAIRVPTGSLPTATVVAVYRSRRQPSLWLIDKENGGKADALNAALNYCHTPYFCAIDADSLLEREALTRIVRPFLEEDRTVAAGGVIRIANGCTVKRGIVTDVRLPRSWWARFQVMEYLRSFLAGRLGWGALNATLIISGAFGLFRRSTVVDAGGYNPATVGEDMELIVRLHRHCRERKLHYRIAFVPDPIAWTECPEKGRILANQRDRWQRGLIESLLLHRRMLFRPSYGRIGWLAFPYFLLLEAFGPVIEVLGYAAFAGSTALGLLSFAHFTAFLVVAFILGVALSVAAVAMEELMVRRYRRFSDILKLFGVAVLENFGYRQLTALWRVRGIVSYFSRVKGWGRMERRGFATEARP